MKNKHSVSGTPEYDAETQLQIKESASRKNRETLSKALKAVIIGVSDEDVIAELKSRNLPVA